VSPSASPVAPGPEPGPQFVNFNDELGGGHSMDTAGAPVRLPAGENGGGLANRGRASFAKSFLTTKLSVAMHCVSLMDRRGSSEGAVTVSRPHGLLWVFTWATGHLW